ASPRCAATHVKSLTASALSVGQSPVGFVAERALSQFLHAQKKTDSALKETSGSLVAVLLLLGTSVALQVVKRHTLGPPPRLRALLRSVAKSSPLSVAD